LASTTSPSGSAPKPFSPVSTESVFEALLDLMVELGHFRFAKKGNCQTKRMAANNVDQEIEDG
jgi:hypothetical protein